MKCVESYLFLLVLISKIIMKTIVKMLAVATILVACYAANAATINTNSNVETTVENSVMNSDYEFVQTVSIIKICRLISPIIRGTAYVEKTTSLSNENERTAFIIPIVPICTRSS